MTLAAGARLGEYEVLSALGAGGMGEVYRARDSRLGRDVAVKLIHGLCSHPDRLARFEREARTLGALNHPNIASVHGFNECDGVCFLVMELVPGATLAEAIASGRLSTSDAIRFGVQISAALEAAHEADIIHRDLKPLNIKVRPDGIVKVLDFGLAKALGDEDRSLLTQSPTLKTDEGAVVGTTAYMSPEQARGQPVDRRADIWAFGCVLFEMLTGRQPFAAPTISDTLVRILDREPDWTLLPADTPPVIERLIRRCLRREAAHRLRDVGDARLELEEALSAPLPQKQARRGTPALTRPAAAAALVVGAIAAATIAATLRSRPAPAHTPTTHFLVALPAGEKLGGLDFPAVAISPDGSQVAYVGTGGGRTQLFLRRMNDLQPTPLAGTATAISPFFSPDGRWIAFFAGGKLKKTALRGGGVPVDICDADIGFGGSWAADGTIVFASTTGSGLSRVSADGGPVSRLTTLDATRGEFSHRWPELLPDGNAVLYTVGTLGSWDDAEIVASEIESGRREVLVKGGTHPRFLPTGHLMYARAGALMVVPFDARRLTVTGAPTRVVESVMESFDGAAQAAISSSGTLVYARGAQQASRRLVGLDSDGVPTALAAPAHAYSFPRYSPEGRRIAVTIADATEDIWLYDISDATLKQLTFEGTNSAPVWSPDGAHIAFSSNRAGALNLFTVPANGSSPPRRLTHSDHVQVPGSWSPDGRQLAFVQHHPSSGRDVWLLPSNSSEPATPLLRSAFDESSPQFSPDGRWLAYVSNERGGNDVFVRSVFGSPRTLQVSTGGGTEPVWARDGQRIFYREGSRLIARGVRGGDDIRFSAPQVIFAGDFERGTIDRSNYDVTPGSTRLLLVAPGEPPHPVESELHVILNWTASLPAVFSRAER